MSDFDEPLYVDKGTPFCDVRTADHSSIIQEADYGHTVGFEADMAARIAAAVNFCQHLSTELMRELTSGGGDAERILMDLKYLADHSSIACPSCCRQDTHADDCLLGKALKILGDKP